MKNINDKNEMKKNVSKSQNEKQIQEQRLKTNYQTPAAVKERL